MICVCKTYPTSPIGEVWKLAGLHSYFPRIGDVVGGDLKGPGPSIATFPKEIAGLIRGLLMDQ